MIDETWIAIPQAAELTGYSRSNIRTLCERERIEAKRFGRDWMVHRESLLAYKRQADELGIKRYAGWAHTRTDGRGRRRTGGGPVKADQ